MWVQRDEKGNINGLAANPSPTYVEELPENNPEVLAFLEASQIILDKMGGVIKMLLPQELMAQLKPSDMVKIMAAVNGDATGNMQLLWFSMVAQRDPMYPKSERVQAGWAALVKVLGPKRMDGIAKALEIVL